MSGALSRSSLKISSTSKPRRTPSRTSPVPVHRIRVYKGGTRARIEKVWNAAGCGWSWPDGKQYRAAAPSRGTSVRGLQPDPKTGRRARGRGPDAGIGYSGPRQKTRFSTRDMGDASCRRRHRRHDRLAERAVARGRYIDRRRQYILQGRHPACKNAGSQEHRLCRCRHLWWNMGPRTRLLHDDRRVKGGRRSSRSDFQGPGAGPWRHRADVRQGHAGSPRRNMVTSTRGPRAPGISSR